MSSEDTRQALEEAIHKLREMAAHEAVKTIPDWERVTEQHGEVGRKLQAHEASLTYDSFQEGFQQWFAPSDVVALIREFARVTLADDVCNNDGDLCGDCELLVTRWLKEKGLPHE